MGAFAREMWTEEGWTGAAPRALTSWLSPCNKRISTCRIFRISADLRKGGRGEMVSGWLRGGFGVFLLYSLEGKVVVVVVQLGERALLLLISESRPIAYLKAARFRGVAVKTLSSAEGRSTSSTLGASWHTS